jgi:hypothetical protein
MCVNGSVSGVNIDLHVVTSTEGQDCRVTSRFVVAAATRPPMDSVVAIVDETSSKAISGYGHCNPCEEVRRRYMACEHTCVYVVSVAFVRQDLVKHYRLVVSLGGLVGVQVRSECYIRPAGRAWWLSS